MWPKSCRRGKTQVGIGIHRKFTAELERQFSPSQKRLNHERKEFNIDYHFGPVVIIGFMGCGGYNGLVKQDETVKNTEQCPKLL
jgi:hypothetical protein